MPESKRDPWYLSVVEFACYPLGFITFFVTAGGICAGIACAISHTLEGSAVMAYVGVDLALLLLTCLCLSTVKLNHHITELTDRHDRLRKKLARLEQLMDTAAADQKSENSTPIPE